MMCKLASEVTFFTVHYLYIQQQIDQLLNRQRSNCSENLIGDHPGRVLCKSSITSEAQGREDGLYGRISQELGITNSQELLQRRKSQSAAATVSYRMWRELLYGPNSLTPSLSSPSHVNFLVCRYALFYLGRVISFDQAVVSLAYLCFNQYPPTSQAIR